MQQALRTDGADVGLGITVLTPVARRLATGRRRRLALLKKLPGAYALFRLATPLALWAGYSRAGFELRWRERGRHAVAFDVTRCLYVDIFRRYGALELVPVFCAVDDYWYEQLRPVIGWHRTTTLATGGRCCDFRYENPHCTGVPSG